MPVTYIVNTIDSEIAPEWMNVATEVTPGAQDSGRCRFAVETSDPAALEAALDADDEVIEYARLERP